MLKFKIYKDEKGEYRWKAVASNGKILADSGEGYKRKAMCERAAASFVTKISDGKFKVIYDVND